ncbi:PREDICTED: pentatricopeptide repeat-containing protein At2g27800, mitochondrial-like isoform X1 [Lupinus angustifolius]|uniref:pentatricopeptide repeat-containing protein At2g27800, mitochondrial-like isoform X1 n=1 Tax=Lupinus angustifolius TaxID=3871 RepID=UPI00092E6BBE|nr:PREDICTED: pentatricopeptide repeat-containing protein At2g27800, mitochondrial-like isoform X1 [Lupinus angustifolius]
MQSFGINCFKYRSYFTRDILNQNPCSINSFCPNFPDQIYQNSQKIRFFHHTHKANPFLFQITVSHTQFPILIAPFRFNPYCYSTKAPSRSYRRRVSNRLLKSQKPILDQAQFQLAISQILPRFTPEELCNVLTLQNDPLVCLELFHWASQKPRFRHDVLTYHVTIKKLGAAKMYQEMDDIVNQVLAVPSVGSEAMFNTIIYYFTEARKLSRAVSIFKHMKSCTKLNCRPSIRTYHIIFSALLSRGNNADINYVYMETIRSLFRQMVNDGIEPDIFLLNLMIKGYVLSLHVNDAMRIFHQMSGVYDCQPNSFTYDYLIHGLCAQDRTNNAKELCLEMKTKGFIPSGKSYNSLVSALALGGEVEEAVNYLWEMTEKQRSVDFITYRTVLDEICRRGRVQEAMRLLQELREKGLVEGHDYRKLHYVLEEDYGNSLSRIAAGPALTSPRNSS